jgi:spore coat protein U-like protein
MDRNMLSRQRDRKDVAAIIRRAHSVGRMTLALLATLAICSPLAFGEAKQQNMPVISQVAVNCSFQAAPSLNFLGYDTNGVNSTLPLDQTALLQISCTRGASTTIGIDSGTHTGQASFGTRALADGTKYLGYDLYQDSARTILWTNTGAGLYNYVSPSSLPTTISIYGRIFSSQNVQAGIYTDTLVVTINY